MRVGAVKNIQKNQYQEDTGKAEHGIKDAFVGGDADIGDHLEENDQEGYDPLRYGEPLPFHHQQRDQRNVEE